MLLLRSPFLVARFCSYSCVVKFLPISLIYSVAWQSVHFILYTAPGLFLGSSALSLTLVSKCRKVNIGLYATRML